MSDLTVRAYNVGFGDAVLVSVPDRAADGTETVRHILIDVGNLLANEDTVFNDVVRDIAKVTGGTVDLYVMTHEHMDHVQGLRSAANAGIKLKADYAWLTGSAAPDYYDDDKHPDAKKKRSLDQARFRGVVAFHAADPDPWLDMMIRNNSALIPDGVLGLKTSDYVDHLRKMAAANHTFYIHRDTKLDGKHPFAEATFRVLAPHENTAEYYGRRATTPTLATAAQDDGGAEASATAADAPVAPPVGVDAGAFFDLVQARRHLNRRTIMEIDAAANNTSIVLELEWRGWKLLFPGDAEEKSWRMMRDEKVLEPVHFIKVSHHGSVNGTDPDVFDVVMPEVAPDNRERSAVVSTHDKDWKSVPDPDTLDLYKDRATLHDTRDVARGKAEIITFAG